MTFFRHWVRHKHSWVKMSNNKKSHHLIMRYAELNFLIPRDHLHSQSAGDPKRSAERHRRVEVFGGAAPESRSVRQSGAGESKCSAERRRRRRVEVFGRAAAECRSVRQSGGGAGELKCSAERRRRVEMFGRAAPESRSVWQSGGG